MCNGSAGSQFGGYGYQPQTMPQNFGSAMPYGGFQPQYKSYGYQPQGFQPQQPRPDFFPMRQPSFGDFAPQFQPYQPNPYQPPPSFTSPQIPPQQPNPQQPNPQQPPNQPGQPQPSQFSLDDPRLRFDQTANGGAQNIGYAETLRSLLPYVSQIGTSFNLLDLPQFRDQQGNYIGPNKIPDFQTAGSDNGVPRGFTGQKGTDQFGMPAFYVNGHGYSPYGGGGAGEPTFRHMFDVNLASVMDRNGKPIYGG